MRPLNLDLQNVSRSINATKNTHGVTSLRNTIGFARNERLPYKDSVSILCSNASKT